MVRRDLLQVRLGEQLRIRLVVLVGPVEEDLAIALDQFTVDDRPVLAALLAFDL